MKTTRFIFFLVLLTSSSLFAQLNFTAKESKQEVALNQRFKITFSLDKQGADNFKLPNMKDFTLVGGPMNSYSQSNINGKVSFSQSFTFFFTPTKKGSFTIKPATVEYKGKVIKSNILKINVVDKVAVPKDPNNPESNAKENIHVVAELSTTTPYVGQSVYLVYKLYVSNKVNAYNPRVMELPKFNGFWNQEIDFPNEGVKKGKYKGESYRYLELKRVLLIPQKSGKLYLDPMKIDIVAEVPTGRADFWGNAQMRRFKINTSTGRRVLNVKPLPLEGKPANFTGAVGDFKYSVINSKPSLKAGESSKITVRVNGVGNLKLFDLPKISTPSDLEVYTPKRKEKVRIRTKGLKGSVTDSYTVVPEYKGKYKIPATSFSYFDLKEETYKTITSNPLIVDVTEGKTAPIPVEEQPKTAIASTDSSFKEITLQTRFSSLKKNNFFKSNLFYLLLLLPLIAIPISMLIGKKYRDRRNDVSGNKIRTANRLAKKYLGEAQKQLGKKEAFYESLEKALHNFLKAKLQVETSDISKEKIAEILANKNVDTSTITAFSDVLEQCNFARFTPTTNLEMQAEFEKAKQVILKIDQQL